jgi:hypothetical protein
LINYPSFHDCNARGPQIAFSFFFFFGFVEVEEELGELGGVGLNFSFLFYEYFFYFSFGCKGKDLVGQKFALVRGFRVRVRGGVGVGGSVVLNSCVSK